MIKPLFFLKNQGKVVAIYSNIRSCINHINYNDTTNEPTLTTKQRIRLYKRTPTLKPLKIYQVLSIMDEYGFFIFNDWRIDKTVFATQFEDIEDYGLDSKWDEFFKNQNQAT
jgi:hypothetical protein